MLLPAFKAINPCYHYTHETNGKTDVDAYHHPEIEYILCRK